uniref:Perilipin n=1 Tax=Pelusios castaneus TaxID=367368 RepID=A0A8C8SHV2_9SAUR
LGQVAGLPLLKSTYEMVSSALASAKEIHPSIKSVCDAAEKGVVAVADAAVTGAQPFLSKPEPRIETAEESGSQGLEKLEEKLPVLQQPDKDLVGPKEQVVTEVVDAKDAVSTRMTEVVDVTKEILQGSLEAARSIVLSTVMGTRLGQMAMSGMEAALEKSEELVDHYLPITDEELAKLAESVEEAEGSAVQHHHGYFVRLGSLSAQLRQRAYQHSLGKVRQAKQGMQESFLQFHEVLDLVRTKNVDQKHQDSQQKLHQMWLDWSSKQPEGSHDQVESHTLAMSHSIAHQLQDTCQTLMASIQGLPSSLQEKVQQVLQNLKELHSSFFAAKSLQDLPSATLTQSQEKMTTAQEYIDELLEYVEHNTPLSWLVGPFAPSARAFVASQEVTEEVAEKEDAD